MKRIVLILVCISAYTAVSSQYRNTIVEVSDERIINPSFAINPDEQNIYALARNNGIIHISLDSGKTWTAHSLNFESVENAEVPETKVLFNKKGDLQAISLIDTMGTGKPTDLASHQFDFKDNIWEEIELFGHADDGFYTGLEAAYDRNTGNYYASWTHTVEDEKKFIKFSLSSRGGKKWSEPQRLNTKDKDGDALISTPSLISSHDGKLFSIWANNETFFLDRSYDKGDMWLRNDITILERSYDLYFDIPQIGILSARPNAAIDLSLSQLRGNIYLIWNELQEGIIDLLLVKTGNMGDTWSQPFKILEEKQSIKYMPKVTIDKGTGILYVAYFSREPGETKSDLYIAFSRTGGTRFKEFKVNSELIDHFSVNINEEILEVKILYGVLSITYATKENNKYKLIHTLVTNDQIDY